MGVGLMSVLGTEIGLAIMIGIFGTGLTAVIAGMGHWFDWVRLAGAAYLAWLGWKMIRPSGELSGGEAPRTPSGGFLMGGSVWLALSRR